MRKIYPDLDYNIFHLGDEIYNINEEEYKRVNNGITLERFTYNFFQYFPGIRNYYCNISKIDKDKKKLIRDLDSILWKLVSDLLKIRPCYELKKQGNFQPLLDFIWPFYKKMLALGYEKEELFYGFRNI